MSKFFEYKGYRGTIESSDEDDVLFGEVIGLKHSLILYEGEDLKALEGDFKDAIDYHLSVCDSEGREPEKPCYDGIGVEDEKSPTKSRSTVIKSASIM